MKNQLLKLLNSRVGILKVLFFIGFLFQNAPMEAGVINVVVNVVVVGKVPVILLMALVTLDVNQDLKTQPIASTVNFCLLSLKINPITRFEPLI